mmetsp:Transcript_4710/g.11755  ORF Transcript_4710/g.11755 Transcript_4710/m.11755 type:complete len:531 (-) Transcript_4710:44-1636(-)
MMSRLTVGALLVGLAATENSVFQINVPASLRKPGGYSHKASLFGRPSYASTTQRLYYAGDGGGHGTLCAFDTTKTYPTPFILMVDRGDCTFVTKARNAQQMGATALVVADNLCVCGAPCSPQAGCQYTEPVLADDGSGADIVIPAVMLPKQEADDIVNYFRCGKLPIQGRPQTCAWSPDWSQEATVQASLEYTVPNPDDRVEWELWTTSIDGASLDFLTAFKDTVLQLGTHQHFAPMMYTYNGSQYGCDVKQTGSDMCGNLCTNGGLYCAPDPDGSQDEGISGADVVAENLRRACLWDLVGGDDVADKNQVGVGKVWWDYVSEFTRLCSTAETFADDNCRATAMKNAGADKQAVDTCVEGSGGLEKGRNDVLDQAVEALDRENIVYVPECIVNGVVHYGSVDPPNILASICQGFPIQDRPPVCDCASDPRYDDCVANNGAAPVSSGSSSSSKDRVVEHDGMPWYGVLMLVVSVVVVMLLAGLAYWKRTQRQMRDQVRGILAEYMPMEDLGEALNPMQTEPDAAPVFSVNA